MRHHTVLRSLATLAAVASLVACGDDRAPSTTGASDPTTTTDTAPTTPDPTPPGSSAPTISVPTGHIEVVRWEEIGGCMVIGPNCPTWTVLADGTVEVSRTSGQPGVDATGVDTSVQATGTVDPALVAAVVREARAVDAPTLLAELGPGACNSCVDGADVVATITDGDRTLFLDSVELAFDPGHPLFVALGELMTQVRLVELPLVGVG